MNPNIVLRFFFLFLFFLGRVVGFSQNEARNWYFGNGEGISFASGIPSVLTGGAITTTNGCSVISSTSGNLLFYTDGQTVYNQTHTVMANGTGLLGTNSFQNAIILKQPQSNNLYYVFTVGGMNTANGLNYSIVDMSLASGMGSVTVKNATVNTNCREKLTAGKHCNGNDLWIVSVEGNADCNFVSCLLTSSGISSVVASSSVVTNSGHIGGNIMTEMKLSPNSRKLATNGYTISNGYNTNILCMFDFDNISGQVLSTNANMVSYFPVFSYTQSYSGSPATGNYYDGEFSPDSRYYYFSQSQILQKYSLCNNTTSLAISNVSVGVEANLYIDTYPKRTFQLAQDGKIYIATQTNTGTLIPYMNWTYGQLGSINNPNNLTTSASYTPLAVYFSSVSTVNNLPNFPGYYFEQKPSPSISYTVSPTTCLTGSFNTPAICSNSGYSLTGYQWNFGDNAASSASTNISFLASPVHAYPQAGTFTVSLIRYFLCNTNDTIRQVITLNQPSLSVVNSPSVCAFTTATAIVSGGIGPYAFLWSSPSQTNASATFTSSGIYSVSVSDLGAGACMAFASTSLSVINLSTTVSHSNVLCFGQSNGSASISTIGGSGNYTTYWSNTTTSVTGLSTLAAGVYSITLIDQANQCSITKSFTITQPPLMTLQLAASAEACIGQSVYVVSNVSGGTPVINYAWNTGAINPFITVTQTLAGTSVYTCTINDANNCSLSQTVSATFYAYPPLSCLGATVCNGDPILLQASGATTYTWIPGGSNSSTLALSPSANLNYTLSGTNAICMSSTLVSVLVNPLPVLHVNASSPVCEGQSILLSSSTHANYFWSGPNSFVSSLQNPILNNVIPAQSGIYSLTVTDLNNCSTTKTLQLVVNASPLISISGNKILCVGESVTLTASGGINFNWSNALGGNVIVVSPLLSTSYTVSAFDPQFSCSGSAQVLVQVNKCTGISVNENDQDLKVLPNPGTGLFTLRSSVNLNYVVLNNMGELILRSEIKEGKSSIDLSAYADGVYYIKCFSSGGTKVLKLLKEK